MDVRKASEGQGKSIALCDSVDTVDIVAHLILTKLCSRLAETCGPAVEVTSLRTSGTHLLRGKPKFLDYQG